MKKIQASVLLINYNKAKLLARCLNHLTKQDFKEFEVIFSDDRSEDNSVLVAKKYIKKLDLKIIKNDKKKFKYVSYNQINSILRDFKKSSGKIKKKKLFLIFHLFIIIKKKLKILKLKKEFLKIIYGLIFHRKVAFL